MSSRILWGMAEGSSAARAEAPTAENCAQIKMSVSNIELGMCSWSMT